MSIVDKNVIDGIALTDNNAVLVMLLSDHLDWKDEYNHLLMLQEKINCYISFFENEQYKDNYPNYKISSGIIEIHFMHNITSNTLKFLKVVQTQISEIGIKIQYFIEDDNENQ